MNTEGWAVRRKGMYVPPVLTARRAAYVRSLQNHHPP